MHFPRATSLLLLVAPALTEAAAVPACSSGKAGDTAFETCGTFCKANHSSSHCPFCKCKACPYCAPGALLASHSHGHGKSTPTVGAAAAVAEAGKPAVRHAHVHLATQKGKAPFQPTCSSGLAGDTSEEGCAAFCKADDPNKAANHCRFCKCRKCDSCASLLSASKTAAAAASAGVASKAAPASQQLRLPCRSKEAGDFSYRTCAPFCQVSKAAGHCLYCKCADCHYCAAMATPAGPRDRGEAGPARPPPVSRLAGAASSPAPLRPATAAPISATPQPLPPAASWRILMLLTIACLPTLLLLGWHALAPAHLSPHALQLKLREQMATAPGTTTADRLFAKVDSRANLVIGPAPLPGHGSGTHAQPAPSPHTAASPASPPALPAHEPPAPSRFAFW